MIVMADCSLDNDSDAMVIGVDAEGVSYILEQMESLVLQPVTSQAT